MTTRERRKKTAEQLAEILEKHGKAMPWKDALTIYRAAIQLRGARPTRSRPTHLAECETACLRVYAHIRATRSSPACGRVVACVRTAAWVVTIQPPPQNQFLPRTGRNRDAVS